jgi:NAD(P)-dependent dehydrogenase (short-subunit alcohol dehydrogenase family)
VGLLNNKVAIITGAGGGLGREYALLLAREGASIVVNDYNADLVAKVVAEIEAAGGRAVGCPCDVGNAVAGEQLVETALQSFGRVDIVINNAGILRDKGFHNLEEADWDEVVRVHLKGLYCVTRPAFKWMRDNKAGGVIVNTTSTSGLIGNFGQSNYAAAKGGIWAATHVLAIEGAKYGIRVWGLAPAAVSALTEHLFDERTRRELDPRYVAPVVLYMVSELSGNKTGKTLYASGQKVMELRLEGAPGIRGGTLDARDIAASEGEIFFGGAGLSLADLGWSE